MFTPDTYRQRRHRLKKEIGSGLLLFLGNEEVGMNYAANIYPFRQDSTFLYFWAVDQPGVAALIDIDQDTETLYGDEQTVADIVWSGPLPTLADRRAPAGIALHAPLKALAQDLGTAIRLGRRVHFLAPYRAEHSAKLTALLGLRAAIARDYRSEVFHAAVIRQRSYKSAEEVADLDAAVDISRQMYAAAMHAAQPGKREYEVVAEIAGAAMSHGARFSFPPICSVHGETLHNPFHHNVMEDGDVLLLDCGAETPRYNASDITRTFPVGGAFSAQQRLIYEMVLRAQLAAIAAIKPGVKYLDVHLVAAQSLATDLKAAGLMQGDVAEGVAAGAHALFFPHGLGHMLGMDVHDMENLEERLVGYRPGLDRSTQFGLGYLRLAREVEPGFVVTVEPGLYFIPALIDQWKADQTHAEFLNFAEIEKFRDARGYRIEDDLLVTATGNRILGPPIPKAVAEVEAACRA